MQMGKKYALFDWDNTVRKGYTLFSWIDFLYNNCIIGKQQLEKINNIKKQYNRKTITHDQFAELACSEYAQALKGVTLKAIQDALEKYINYDRESLFNNIEDLFDLLYENHIDIIVISGAPTIILDKYKNDLHIKTIFAFEEKVNKGIFTGTVKCNYGFDKKEKVIELIDEYGCTPYMGFGDSASDIPILENANYSFCVGNNLKNINWFSISPNSFSKSIQTIEHLLKL